MSPISFPSPARDTNRRRFAPPTAASLFPDSPVTQSPKHRIADPAPVGSDPRSSNTGTHVTDCPPAQAVSTGPQSPEETGTRAAVAKPACGVNAPLVGIARLAAKSPAAETQRKSAEKPQYFFLPVKSILNRCESRRVPFEWTINPYRGCEFGCHYCYARYTHEYMELDGGEFEKRIFVKQDAAALLNWDVSHKYSWESAASGGQFPDHIAIGTATDPYQPAEKEYGVTRACLEELAKREGLSISVITKSNQIVRDIDVFKRIAERSSLSLNLTITTMRPRLARLLEPRAPRPDLRVAAVKQLADAGSRARGRGAVVFLQCTLSHAIFGKTISAIHPREIPQAGKAIRRLVRKTWLRAAGISAESVRTRRANPQEVWIFYKAVGGTVPDITVLANVPEVGREFGKWGGKP
jgi:hypothetical protein